MKRLLFVDHDFHLSTASSQFFVDILKKRFDVSVAYVAPPSDISEQTLRDAADVDLVVIWQMDYLAPVFLALGIPTIVVPMYDGSSTMPDLHWLVARRAHFINFSFTLHHQIASLGNKSFLTRYFKPPVPEAEIATFDDGLKAFLWQRRPEHGINAAHTMRLLGDQISSLHVHNAPDDPKLNTAPYRVASKNGFPITESRWFADASGYQQALARCNVFIAPRRAEGIGMALLEAMARGMVVIADDVPTHNEYICNHVNGVLYSHDHHESVRIDEPGVLGRSAYETVRAGYPQWQEQALQIVSLIDALEKHAPVDIGNPGDFAKALSGAYYSGISSYTAFMLNHLDVFGRISGVSLGDRVDHNGTVLPTPAKARSVSSSIAWLQGDSLPTDAVQVQPYIAVGIIEHAAGVASIQGHAVELVFRADPAALVASRVTLSIDLPAPLTSQTIIAALNDWTLGIVEVGADMKSVSFALPPQTLRGENRLRLQTTAIGGDRLSLHIRGIRFA